MENRAFILVAEDQPDDAFLFEHTFAGLGIADYYIANDGSETIAYLEGTGQFTDRAAYPLPDCLLLDLKMPMISGFEVLEWIRGHADHRLIPTVVFSSSNDPCEIQRAYDLGANSYFCKCGKIDEMVRQLSLIEEYWTEAKCPRRSVARKFVARLPNA
jgi:CheY-like chemotaxis protein